MKSLRIETERLDYQLRKEKQNGTTKSQRKLNMFHYHTRLFTKHGNKIWQQIFMQIVCCFWRAHLFSSKCPFLSTPNFFWLPRKLSTQFIGASQFQSIPKRTRGKKTPKLQTQKRLHWVA